MMINELPEEDEATLKTAVRTGLILKNVFASRQYFVGQIK